MYKWLNCCFFLLFICTHVCISVSGLIGFSWWGHTCVCVMVCNHFLWCRVINIINTYVSINNYTYTTRTYMYNICRAYIHILCVCMYMCMYVFVMDRWIFWFDTVNSLLLMMILFCFSYCSECISFCFVRNQKMIHGYVVVTTVPYVYTGSFQGIFYKRYYKVFMLLYFITLQNTTLFLIYISIISNTRCKFGLSILRVFFV